MSGTMPPTPDKPSVHTGILIDQWQFLSVKARTR